MSFTLSPELSLVLSSCRRRESDGILDLTMIYRLHSHSPLSPSRLYQIIVLRLINWISGGLTTTWRHGSTTRIVSQNYSLHLCTYKYKAVIIIRGFFTIFVFIKSTKETYFMFLIPSSKRSNFSLLHLLFGPIWRKQIVYFGKLNIKY